MTGLSKRRFILRIFGPRRDNNELVTVASCQTGVQRRESRVVMLFLPLYWSCPLTRCPSAPLSCGTYYSVHVSVGRMSLEFRREFFLARWPVETSQNSHASVLHWTYWNNISMRDATSESGASRRRRPAAF